MFRELAVDGYFLEYDTDRAGAEQAAQRDGAVRSIAGRQLAPGLLGLTRQRRQHLDEHWHHHLGPALADQRQGSVKIKEHVADVRPRGEARTEFDQTLKGGGRKHLLVS